jgi:hypothetical protein
MAEIKKQIDVAAQTIWYSVRPLITFRGPSQTVGGSPERWTPSSKTRSFRSIGESSAFGMSKPTAGPGARPTARAVDDADLHPR